VSEQAAPVLRCRSCGAAVPDEQEWCLECGYGARTRIVPPPRHRRVTASLTAVAVIAFAVLAAAFAGLTADHGRIPKTITTTTPAPAATTATPAVPGTTTAPAGPSGSQTPAGTATLPANPATTPPQQPGTATAPPPLAAP